jgi:hypothetical protein
MDLHLNSSGGFTGGMFIAAMLDAFPRYEDRVLAAIDTLDGDYPVACFLASEADFELKGCRFEIEPFHKYFGHIPLAFPVAAQGDSHSHERLTWGVLRQRLVLAPLASAVRAHAISIFGLLVAAESSAQATAPDKVAFPEVAAWQALAEIIGAAALIDAMGSARWTATPVSELSSAGAAILRYLCPEAGDRSLPSLRTLVGTGVGFGPQRGTQKSYLRVLCFEESDAFDAPQAGSRARAISPERTLKSAQR